MMKYFQPGTAADLEARRQQLLTDAEGEVAPYSDGFRGDGA